MGQGGGYVLAPSHNFGDVVPIENILAFLIPNGASARQPTGAQAGAGPSGGKDRRW
jgi:hypothetical protein